MARLFRLCLLFSLAVLLCFSGMEEALAESVTVKGGYLRMRTSPDREAFVLERYPTGTVLTVLGDLGEWMYVQASDGNKGYMQTSYLEKGASSTVASSGTAYVTSSNGKSVNMRSRARKNATVLTQLSVGTRVKIVGSSGSWKKVTVNSRTGYIMSQYLSTAKVSPPSSSSSSNSSATTGRVRSDNGKAVNMRSGPGKKYSVIGSYEVGTRVKILKSGSVWSYISINGQVGYMKSEYIR